MLILKTKNELLNIYIKIYIYIYIKVVNKRYENIDFFFNKKKQKK